MLSTISKLLAAPRGPGRALGCALALALAALPGPPCTPSAPGDPLDFVRTGKEFLARHGLDPAALPPDAFQQLLSKACLNLRMGPVSLYLPKDGFRPESARGKEYPAATETLGLAAPAVLRALAQVGRWSGEAGAAALVEKDFRDLTGMIEIGKDFDPDAAPGPWGLEQMLGKDLDKREQALLEKVGALLACSLLAPEADGAGVHSIPMLVLPTRKEMVEFLCVAGVLDAAVAGIFHQPAITGWMHSYYGAALPLGRVNILCLEEGHVGDGAIERWTEPSQDTDRFLAQHTISYDTLVALLAGQGPMVPNWLALGLGFQGVLEQYGNIAGRLGADSVGDVTPPRQAFVPGGQSNGGQFPPNLSALRGTIIPKELLRVLEERKQAAYERLQDRDAGDPQRKAAQSGEEVVFLNFRDAQTSEEGGYLHFGPYLGQDLSFLTQKDASHDLALTQRALFTMVAVELAAREKGAALTRLMAVLPAAGEDFEERFAQAVGATPSELERALFAKIKKK